MNRPSLEGLGESLWAAFPKLDDAQRRLALAAYRRLARAWRCHRGRSRMTPGSRPKKRSAFSMTGLAFTATRPTE